MVTIYILSAPARICDFVADMATRSSPLVKRHADTATGYAHRLPWSGVCEVLFGVVGGWVGVEGPAACPNGVA